MSAADPGALLRARRYAEAAVVLREVACSQPGEWRNWLNLAHVLRTLGAIGEAADAYRRAIALNSGCGAAWWGLANLKAGVLGAEDVAAMRAALAMAGVDRVPLHFALAAALDGLGEHAAAFEQLRLGNALRLAQAPHDAERTSAGFRRTEALLTADFVAARRGAEERGPVFVVGLPRSGSTLVEQMLASHPQVEALGELHELNQVARELAGEGYLDGLTNLSRAQLAALGRQYLAAAQRYRTTDRPLFVDKMPSNWVYAGLIPLILPGARIVDVRRHPMACGIANYAQHYAGGNNWAYDLSAIGRFTVDYVRYMAHVDRVAPGTVHRVIYEGLVADPEAELRRLLAFLDLPYDAACLRFHESARAVGTPSSAQVRRPIGREGLERWRAYERWLGSLEQALGSALTGYSVGR